MQRFTFETDDYSYGFCKRIADALARRLGISIDQAMSLINSYWKESPFFFERAGEEFASPRFHWTEEQWADRIQEWSQDDLPLEELVINPGLANHARHGHVKLREVYADACSLLEGLLILDDGPVKRIGPDEQRRLRRATELLGVVHKARRDHWQTIWLLGKTNESLGNIEQAYHWFCLAGQKATRNADVLREASIAAMKLGRSLEAVNLAKKAIESAANDAGLSANLALALLFVSKPDDAKMAIEKSLSRDPTDDRAKKLASIIDDVREGRRACPAHLQELV